MRRTCPPRLIVTGGATESIGLVGNQTVKKNPHQLQIQLILPPCSSTGCFVNAKPRPDTFNRLRCELIIAAETFETVINWSDNTTCKLSFEGHMLCLLRLSVTFPPLQGEFYGVPKELKKICNSALVSTKKAVAMDLQSCQALLLAGAFL